MKLFVHSFLALFLTYCANSGDQANLSYAQQEADYMEESYDMEEGEKKLAFNDEQASTSEAEEEKDNRKIIRTAEIYMEVDDYPASQKQLRELIEQYKAYVASESEQKTDYRIQNQFVIRLEPDRLDAFVGGLEGIASNVDNKRINAKEVTREYIDLETRLNSKREVVKRYETLLQSARTVEDILEIEEKLRLLVEEIESVEGQLRYLSNQVQWSTVNLTMYETLHRPVTKGKSFLKRFSNAIKTGWEVLQELILGLVSIWPIVLLFSAGIFYFLRRRKRKQKS